MFGSLRGRLALAVLTAATVLVTGCGTAASSDPAAGGGEISVAFPNEPSTLDPAFSTQISSDRNILNMFFDPLLRMNADGTLQPALASDWSVSPDGLEVSLTLREGVVFHDGTPFDADAVAANLQRTIDPEVKAPKAATLSSIDAVVVSSPTTVTLQLNRPDPVLLTQLAHESGMMSSPAALEAEGTDYGREPVGTGPFRFELWRTGVSLQAERNPDYWGTAPDGRALPLLDAITYRFITDEQVTLAELRTGGVDLVFNLPPSSYAQAQNDPNITAENIGRLRSYYVALDVSEAPFDDERVRRAFAMAVDREQIGQVTAAGEFDLSPSFATRDDYFYSDAIQPPARDVAGARALLAEAGYPDGVDISVLLRRRPPDPQIGELLQAQLAEAGFRVTVEPAELQSVTERLRNKDYDAGVLVIDVPRIDPSATFDPYFGSTAASNWSGLADPVIDDALTQAKAVDDPQVRAEQYQRVQQQIVDQSYWVFLHQPRSPIFHRSELQGLVFDVDRQWRLDQAFLAQP